LEPNWHSLIQSVRRLAEAEDAVQRVDVQVTKLRRQLEGTSVLEALRSLPKLGELELWSARPARTIPATGPVREKGAYGDSAVERALATSESPEALAWLNQDGFRMLVSLEKNDAIALVEHLYQHGAQNVTVLGIERGRETYGGFDCAFAAMLVVHLSQTESLRKRLFDWLEDRNRLRGSSTTPGDDGQQYLVLSWLDL
jgi:hypothetical protein